MPDLHMRGNGRTPYKSTFEWHEVPKLRRPEFPEDHHSRARIDCTDRGGHVLETVLLSAPAYPLLVPGRAAAYARLNAKYGEGEIFIFFNNLSTKETSDG